MTAMLTLWPGDTADEGVTDKDAYETLSRVALAAVLWF